MNKTKTCATLSKRLTINKTLLWHKFDVKGAVYSILYSACIHYRPISWIFKNCWKNTEILMKRELDSLVWTWLEHGTSLIFSTNNKSSPIKKVEKATRRIIERNQIDDFYVRAAKDVKTKKNFYYYFNSISTNFQYHVSKYQIISHGEEQHFKL